MSTKITTPTLIDLPGETLTSENTEGVILPKGTTAERPGSISVEYLVVAGGGGGGGASGGGGGGGGAGGLLTNYSGTAVGVASGASIDITVGIGGTGGGNSTAGTNGGNSKFDIYEATGGGGGGGYLAASGNGGSGGGGAGNLSSSNTGYDGGLASPAGQGNAGGHGGGSGTTSGGGGGGAGAVGGNGNGGTAAGDGGNGLEVNIIGGTGNFYAGGGAGGIDSRASSTSATGGNGGGGNGASNGNQAIAGTNNKGGGGGGSAWPEATYPGKDGGSGVVILRYSDEYTIVETTSVLTFTTDSTSVPNTKITTFTAGTNGVIQFTPTTTPSTGEFRYNTTDKLVEFYNGSTWKQIATEYISGQPSTCICNLLTTATALYQFEDNINDTCGSHNLSTFNNSAYGTGKFGKAADFNGTNANILSSSGSPEIFTNASGGTISFWFKSDNLSGNQDMVSAHKGSWSGNYGWIIRVVSILVKVYVYNTGAGNALSTSTCRTIPLD